MKKRQSIENRIAFTLIGYTIFIVLLLWAFQILFLNSYYHTMRRNAVMKAGSEIAAAAKGETLESTIESICYQNRMSCLVFDSSGRETISVDMLGRMSFIHSPLRHSMDEVVKPVINGEKNEAVFRFKEQRFKNEAIIYARTATNANNEKITILLNAQLSPVDATKEILQSQIKLIAVMLIAIALLLSKFAAAKLSNPIKEITNKAKRLANGDYIADYDGGGVYEIDQLAQALNFSAEGLSKVEELRRELVANVSHDLKTPLTMIKAYAEMIRDLTGDDKQRRDEQLEVIISESDRLTALVTDLIRTSREEQNKQYKKEQFSPKEMIENIAARFSQLHSDYTIITELQTDSIAIADRESIGQVLYNLISNAINYTGEDKTVKVDLFSVSDETLRIEISDSGKGIPPEELPLIWERYYRSKNTHQRPVAGTGLGLSIVKSALAGQNLKFGVMSEIEKGSTFWFELPTK